MDLSEYLTSHEAAEKYGLHPNSIEQGALRGYFPHAEKRGKTWLIPIVELDARYANGNPGRGRPKNIRENGD